MKRGNGLKRGVRTRTVMSRSACHFYVLKKESLDNLRDEIPVLDMVITRVEAVGKCGFRDSLATRAAPPAPPAGEADGSLSMSADGHFSREPSLPADRRSSDGLLLIPSRAASGRRRSDGSPLRRESFSGQPVADELVLTPKSETVEVANVRNDMQQLGEKTELARVSPHSSLPQALLPPCLFRTVFLSLVLFACRWRA